MHNIKPTKMNYIKSEHWVGQKMVTVLTNWSKEDEWGEDEEYKWQKLWQSLFCGGGWEWAGEEATDGVLTSPGYYILTDAELQ